MSNNSSEEINFQHYVEAVKNKEMTWNIFLDFIKDLSYNLAMLWVFHNIYWKIVELEAGLLSFGNIFRCISYY